MDTLLSAVAQGLTNVTQAVTALIVVLLLVIKTVAVLLLLAMLLVPLTAIGLVVLLAVAAVRNRVTFVIHTALDCVALLAVVPARAIHSSTRVLTPSIGAAMSGLAYSGPRPPGAPPTWEGWDLIGPLIYFLAFALTSAGDLYFSTLGFAALLGQATPSLPRMPIDLDLAAGALFVTLSTIFGFVLLDLYGGTPIQQPWGSFGLRGQWVLKALTAVAVVVTCAAAVSFTIWRQLQLPPPGADVAQYMPPEPWNTALPIVIWALLAVLLVLASGMTGWAAFVSIGAAYTVLLVVVRAVFVVGLTVLYGATELLRRFDVLVIALLDIPAGIGLRLWNWLSGFPMARRLGFTPLTHDTHPPIGQDIDLPLL